MLASIERSGGAWELLWTSPDCGTVVRRRSYDLEELTRWCERNGLGYVVV